MVLLLCVVLALLSSHTAAQASTHLQSAVCPRAGQCYRGQTVTITGTSLPATLSVALTATTTAAGTAECVGVVVQSSTTAVCTLAASLDAVGTFTADRAGGAAKPSSAVVHIAPTVTGLSRCPSTAGLSPLYADAPTEAPGVAAKWVWLRGEGMPLATTATVFFLKLRPDMTPEPFPSVDLWCAAVASGPPGTAAGTIGCRLRGVPMAAAGAGRGRYLLALGTTQTADGHIIYGSTTPLLDTTLGAEPPAVMAIHVAVPSHGATSPAAAPTVTTASTDDAVTLEAEVLRNGHADCAFAGTITVVATITRGQSPLTDSSVSALVGTHAAVLQDKAEASFGPLFWHANTSTAFDATVVVSCPACTAFPNVPGGVAAATVSFAAVALRRRASFTVEDPVRFPRQPTALRLQVTNGRFPDVLFSLADAQAAFGGTALSALPEGCALRSVAAAAIAVPSPGVVTIADLRAEPRASPTAVCEGGTLDGRSCSAGGTATLFREDFDKAPRSDVTGSGFSVAAGCGVEGSGCLTTGPAGTPDVSVLRLTTPAPAATEPAPAVTTGVWVRPSASGPSKTIVSLLSTTDSCVGFGFGVGLRYAAGDPFVAVELPGAFTRISTTIPLRQWTHLLLTASPTLGLLVFVNATERVRLAPAALPAGWWVGTVTTAALLKRCPAFAPFHGALDSVDVRLSTVPTAADVRAGPMRPSLTTPLACSDTPPVGATGTCDCGAWPWAAHLALDAVESVGVVNRTCPLASAASGPLPCGSICGAVCLLVAHVPTFAAPTVAHMVVVDPVVASVARPPVAIGAAATATVTGQGLGAGDAFALLRTTPGADNNCVALAAAAQAMAPAMRELYQVVGVLDTASPVFAEGLSAVLPFTFTVWTAGTYLPCFTVARRESDPVPSPVVVVHGTIDASALTPTTTAAGQVTSVHFAGRGLSRFDTVAAFPAPHSCGLDAAELLATGLPLQFIASAVFTSTFRFSTIVPRCYTVCYAVVGAVGVPLLPLLCVESTAQSWARLDPATPLGQDMQAGPWVVSVQGTGLSAAGGDLIAFVAPSVGCDNVTTPGSYELRPEALGYVVAQTSSASDGTVLTGSVGLLAPGSYVLCHRAAVTGRWTRLEPIVAITQAVEAVAFPTTMTAGDSITATVTGSGLSPTGEQLWFVAQHLACTVLDAAPSAEQGFSATPTSAPTARPEATSVSFTGGTEIAGPYVACLKLHTEASWRRYDTSPLTVTAVVSGGAVTNNETMELQFVALDPVAVRVEGRGLDPRRDRLVVVRQPAVCAAVDPDAPPPFSVPAAPLEAVPGLRESNWTVALPDPGAYSACYFLHQSPAVGIALPVSFTIVARVTGVRLSTVLRVAEAAALVLEGRGLTPALNTLLLWAPDGPAGGCDVATLFWSVVDGSGAAALTNPATTAVPLTGYGVVINGSSAVASLDGVIPALTTVPCASVGCPVAGSGDVLALERWGHTVDTAVVPAPGTVYHRGRGLCSGDPVQAPWLRDDAAPVPVVPTPITSPALCGPSVGVAHAAQLAPVAGGDPLRGATEVAAAWAAASTVESGNISVCYSPQPTSASQFAVAAVLLFPALRFERDEAWPTEAPQNARLALNMTVSEEGVVSPRPPLEYALNLTASPPEVLNPSSCTLAPNGTCLTHRVLQHRYGPVDLTLRPTHPHLHRDDRYLITHTVTIVATTTQLSVAVNATSLTAQTADTPAAGAVGVSVTAVDSAGFPVTHWDSASYHVSAEVAPELECQVEGSAVCEASPDVLGPNKTARFVLWFRNRTFAPPGLYAVTLTLRRVAPDPAVISTDRIDIAATPGAPVRPALLSTVRWAPGPGAQGPLLSPPLLPVGYRGHHSAALPYLVDAAGFVVQAPRWDSAAVWPNGTVAANVSSVLGQPWHGPSAGVTDGQGGQAVVTFNDAVRNETIHGSFNRTGVACAAAATTLSPVTRVLPLRYGDVSTPERAVFDVALTTNVAATVALMSLPSVDAPPLCLVEEIRDGCSITEVSNATAFGTRDDVMPCLGNVSYAQVLQLNHGGDACAARCDFTESLDGVARGMRLLLSLVFPSGPGAAVNSSYVAAVGTVTVTSVVHRLALRRSAQSLDGVVSPPELLTAAVVNGDPAANVTLEFTAEDAAGLPVTSLDRFFVRDCTVALTALQEGPLPPLSLGDHSLDAATGTAAIPLPEVPSPYVVQSVLRCRDSRTAEWATIAAEAFPLPVADSGAAPAAPRIDTVACSGSVRVVAGRGPNATAGPCVPGAALTLHGLHFRRVVSAAANGTVCTTQRSQDPTVLSVHCPSLASPSPFADHAWLTVTAAIGNGTYTSSVRVTLLQPPVVSTVAGCHDIPPHTIRCDPMGREEITVSGARFGGVARLFFVPSAASGAPPLTAETEPVADECGNVTVVSDTRLLCVGWRAAGLHLLPVVEIDGVNSTGLALPARISFQPSLRHRCASTDSGVLCGRGYCDWASGLCRCEEHWRGAACDSCDPGRWGPACAGECPGGVSVPCGGPARGVCNEGPSGDGACVCHFGLTGLSCGADCPGGRENPCSGRGECTTTGCVCHNSTATGFWTGTDCSGCQDGFGGLSCTGVCPTMSGQLCSGHGLCLAACVCETGFCGAGCHLSGTVCDALCPSGFWGSACNRQCPVCGSHGACSQGPYGTGDCICSDGWVGAVCDGECPGGESNPCSRQGTCTSSTTCSCAQGFVGQACEYVCPRSGNVVCSGNGECNATGSCVCALGFRGAACELQCPGSSAASCFGHGVCDEAAVCHCSNSNTTGYYGGADCAGCAAEWYGAQCTQQCPRASGSQCGGHGTCTNPDVVCACVGSPTAGFWTGAACTDCAYGYYGPQCTSACPGGCVPCGGHGICDMGRGGTGSCACTQNATGWWSPPGCVDCMENFYGPQCTLECRRDTTGRVCSGHGVCRTGVNGDGTCNCAAGSGGYWTDTLCTECADGFFGSECTQVCPGAAQGNTCSGHGVCGGTSGTNGTCACHVDFRGLACEHACPLAATAVCAGHGTCAVPKTGDTTAAVCTCDDGFVGAACDACAPFRWGPACKPCLCTRGVCSEGITGTGVCICATGWVGADCDQECAGGFQLPCTGHGTCNPDTTCTCHSNAAQGFFVGSVCASCDARYESPNCTVACPVAGGAVCAGRGQCYNGYCMCDDGFCGTACDINAASVCCPERDVFGPTCAERCPVGPKGLTCSGHGLCFNGRQGNGTCQCEAGFSGSSCNFGCPGGDRGPCNLFGSCDLVTATCTCIPGYAGPDCGTKCIFDPTTGVECSGHGQCNDGALGDGTCVCSLGFWGADCAHACPGMPNASCTGHGTCRQADGACLCTTAFTGTECAVCAEGRWGTECAQSCVNGRSVAKVCECHPWWAGPSCDVPCTGLVTAPDCSDVGCLDLNTSLTCNGAPPNADGTPRCAWAGDQGRCFGAVSCIRTVCSGHGTCDAGRQGAGTCACESDWYGAGCDVSCSAAECRLVRQVVNAQCSPTGACECLNTADEHYQDMSTGCTLCVDGFWGPACGIPCACSGHGSCHQVSGVCTCFDDDARGHWTGDTCAACAAAYIGTTCAVRNVRHTRYPGDAVLLQGRSVTAAPTVAVVTTHTAVLVVAAGTSISCRAMNGTTSVTDAPAAVVGGTVGVSSDIVTLALLENDVVAFRSLDAASCALGPVAQRRAFISTSAAASTTPVTTVTAWRGQALVVFPDRIVPQLLPSGGGLPRVVLSPIVILGAAFAADANAGAGAVILAGHVVDGNATLWSVLLLSESGLVIPWVNATSGAVGGVVPGLSSARSAIIVEDDVLLLIADQQGVGAVRLPVPSAASVKPATAQRVLFATTNGGSPMAWSVAPLLFDSSSKTVTAAVRRPGEASVLLKLSVESGVSLRGLTDGSFIGFDPEVFSWLVPNASGAVTGAMGSGRTLIAVTWTPGLVRVVGFAMYAASAVTPTVADTAGGTPVTVHGEGFPPASVCLFGSGAGAAAVVPIAIQDSAVVCLAPVGGDESCAGQELEVRVLDHATANGVRLRRAPAAQPTAALVSNHTFASVAGGVDIMVTGTGFVESNAPHCRLFDSVSTLVSAPAVWVSGGTLRCVLPPGLPRASIGQGWLATSHDGTVFSQPTPFTIVGAAANVTFVAPQDGGSYKSEAEVLLRTMTVAVVDEGGHSLGYLDPEPRDLSFDMVAFNADNASLVVPPTALLSVVAATNATRDGFCIFADVRLRKPPVGFGVLAVTAPGGWATTLTVRILEGEPYQLRVGVAPSPQFSNGVALEQQPVLVVEDVSGNVIATFADKASPVRSVTAEFDGVGGVRTNVTAEDEGGRFEFKGIALEGVHGAQYQINFFAPGVVSAAHGGMTLSPCRATHYGALGTAACIACPDSGVCNGSTRFSITDGWWRVAPSSYVVYSCARPYSVFEACVGGGCAPGYGGARCAVCQRPDYGRSASQCVRCGSFALNVFVVLLLVLAACVGLGVLLFLAFRTTKRNPHAVFVKILINHMQIVAQLGTVVTSMPSAVLDLIGLQSTASSADPTALAAVDCLFRPGFHAQFIAVVLMPWVAIAAAVAVLAFLHARWRFLEEQLDLERQRGVLGPFRTREAIAARREALDLPERPPLDFTDPLRRVAPDVRSRRAILADTSAALTHVSAAIDAVSALADRPARHKALHRLRCQRRDLVRKLRVQEATFQLPVGSGVEGGGVWTESDSSGDLGGTRERRLSRRGTVSLGGDVNANEDQLPISALTRAAPRRQMALLFEPLRGDITAGAVLEDLLEDDGIDEQADVHTHGYGSLPPNFDDPHALVRSRVRHALDMPIPAAADGDALSGSREEDWAAQEEFEEPEEPGTTNDAELELITKGRSAVPLPTALMIGEDEPDHGDDVEPVAGAPLMTSLQPGALGAAHSSDDVSDDEYRATDPSALQPHLQQIHGGRRASSLVGRRRSTADFFDDSDSSVGLFDEAQGGDWSSGDTASFEPEPSDSDDEAEEEAAQAASRSLAGRAVLAGIVVFLLTYVSIVHKCLLAWRCDSVTDGTTTRRWLYPDRAVDCDSDQHERYTAAALVLGLLYGVGVPVALCAAVVAVGHSRGMAHAMQTFAYFTAGYRSDLWWWEAVVLLRKLGLIICVVFVQEGDLRLYACTWLIAAAIAVHVFARPYTQASLYHVETVSLASILVTLHLAMLAPFAADVRGGSAVLAVAVVGLNVGVVALILGLILKELFVLLDDLRRRHAATLHRLWDRTPWMKWWRARAERLEQEQAEAAWEPEKSLPQYQPLGLLSPPNASVNPVDAAARSWLQDKDGPPQLSRPDDDAAAMLASFQAPRGLSPSARRPLSASRIDSPGDEAVVAFGRLDLSASGMPTPLRSLRSPDPMLPSLPVAAQRPMTPMQRRWVMELRRHRPPQLDWAPPIAVEDVWRAIADNDLGGAALLRDEVELHTEVCRARAKHLDNDVRQRRHSNHVFEALLRDREERRKRFQLLAGRYDFK